MIKLTQIYGSNVPLYLNVDYIVSMFEENGETLLWDSLDETDDPWRVKESPDQIMAMISSGVTKCK